MEHKKKKVNQGRLEENKLDKKQPELLESTSTRPADTPDVDDRQEELDKKKKGDVGAEQFRLDKDGEALEKEKE